MDKTLQVLGLMLLVACMLGGNAFADQEYRGRNIFNRFTDWTATLGKKSEDKDRIINQRVETRARIREAHAKKEAQEGAAAKEYSDRMKEVNVGKADAQANNSDAAAVEETGEAVEQKKSEPEKKQLSPEEQIKAQRDEIIESYAKHMNDLRFQYRNDPDTLKERLKEAEDGRKKKLDDLEQEDKFKDASLDSHPDQAAATVKEEVSGGAK